ncbi:hypothetical protein DEO72_LG8g2114 [Vigna unguiculata]|uniref:Uncharacterized protein n=1 Tax=Vigna unguiculata TaxID=3917 RepID=A0A4D6MTY8_VIGUN|nr:hypothetical protein DEO72_LG8g2114 [Vigna unguiculata]
MTFGVPCVDWRFEEESTSLVAVVGRIPMETVTEVREDPPEEIAKSVDRGIVLLERVSTIEHVCHGQEGAAEKFFYMYMCHFSQLHVRLPLDDFTMGSFKHFKDGYFKVVVKEGGKSHFLNADGSTKFPFSLTGSPSWYKDIGTDELSAADREVVEVLMKTHGSSWKEELDVFSNIEEGEGREGESSWEY